MIFAARLLTTTTMTIILLIPPSTLLMMGVLVRLAPPNHHHRCANANGVVARRSRQIAIACVLFSRVPMMRDGLLRLLDLTGERARRRVM